MIAALLTPLTVATLIGTEIESHPSAPPTVPATITVVADTAKKEKETEEFQIPEEFRIKLLSMDILKRLAATKKELAEVAKKHPQLGGSALGIAMQSKNLKRFSDSEAFQELVKKHGFTFDDFFYYYNEVISGIFLLNVEKQTDQENINEAQGFKAHRQNKEFVRNNLKYIEEDLKLGDSYVGEKPVPPPLRDNRDPNNPFDPGNDREETRFPDQMDPTNPFGL